MGRNYQKEANAIARQAGFGKATEIVFGTTARVLSHTSYGYRKYTTDEYVPNSYRFKFGWKNTYYQHAETVVELPSPAPINCSTGEGGAHWVPRSFSPAIAAIFAEQNRSLYVDGLMHDDLHF